MVPDTLEHAGRNLRFAVSDNAARATRGGAGQVWAVNIHGFFAGGGMYWRESAALADDMGWRLVNPCLPAFGDSDPLPTTDLSIAALADRVEMLLDHLDVERAVLLGHSMGGAVAVEFADRHPERTLGIAYRDGIATPAWRERNGIVARALGAASPDLGGMTDLIASWFLDWPDLLVGRRLTSTLRRLWPDARHNLRAMSGIMAVGSMLMTLDLRPELARVVDSGIPLLPVWGCFDRIATAATAREFARLSGQTVTWVPGGHSWMLPRPKGQSDVLLRLEAGRRFVERVERRERQLEARSRRSSARRAPAAG
jgi:pimeloyl-ACP methyl ester carboxylesterase